MDSRLRGNDKEKEAETEKKKSLPRKNTENAKRKNYQLSVISYQLSVKAKKTTKYAKAAKRYRDKQKLTSCDR